MSRYEDWRVSLSLRSPLGTPMQSDTLFGHLCWKVSFEEGEEGIRDFLDPFQKGEPPFVLSDAFPAGLLPRPLFPRRMVERENREEYVRDRQREKASFLRTEDFLRLIRKDGDDWEPVADPWLSVSTPHAAISRRTWSTGGESPEEAGRLHFGSSLVLPGNRLEVYFRCLPNWKDRLFKLFRSVAQFGFGKDRSVGYGSFSIDELEPWDGFDFFEGADCFISLSTMMPSRDDPINGRWRLRIKRGFLGEHTVSGNPFKRPLIQFEPGSVFKLEGRPFRPFYGRLVRDIAPGMKEAVQCGLALALPARWSTA